MAIDHILGERLEADRAVHLHRLRFLACQEHAIDNRKGETEKERARTCASGDVLLNFGAEELVLAERALREVRQTGAAARHVRFQLGRAESGLAAHRALLIRVIARLWQSTRSQSRIDATQSVPLVWARRSSARAR